MSSIEIDVVIHHRVPVVWEELRHIERHVNWMSDAQRIDFHTDQREGVGTAFDCFTKVGPFTTTDVMTITHWQDGAIMGVTHRGLFTGRGEFVLADMGDTTRLTWREDLRFPWWAGAAVGAALARPVLRVIWRKNLANLARVLDERVS